MATLRKSLRTIKYNLSILNLCVEVTSYELSLYQQGVVCQDCKKIFRKFGVLLDIPGAIWTHWKKKICYNTSAKPLGLASLAADAVRMAESIDQEVLLDETDIFGREP